ncbi:MAG: VWA domain-containing protein [Candidatus Gracilibacteria bacterium]|nr:VWA domain-containing protein [Candidatus Gracilibacteria bacterium]
MIFLSPYLFLLLLLLPFLIWTDFRSRKKGAYFRASVLLEKIYGQSQRKYFYLPLFLKIVLFSLFVCILANPVSSSVRTDISKKGIDIAIVFDISKSMLAEDIKPNRIEAAKRVMSDFVSRFTSDRLAIVLFAGKPFLSTPLTFDYTALVNAVEQMTTDSIRQDIPGLSGTAMGDGLLVALDTLKEDEKTSPRQPSLPTLLPEGEGSMKSERRKVIIVLTDGEANMGINPTIAAKLAKEQEVKIYTLGIGDPVGMELYVTDRFGEKQYFLDQTGKPIRATLDEKMLTSIANITGGMYYNAKDENSLMKIFKELEKLTKTEMKTTSVIVQHPEYRWFLWGIIFLLPFWLWLSFGRFRGRE